MQLEIWTDGSFYAQNELLFEGDINLGSWSFIITDGSRELFKSCGIYIGAESCNHMELLAILKALKRNADHIGQLVLFSDSEFVVNGLKSNLPKWVENNWRRTNNKKLHCVSLWKELHKFNKLLKPRIHWVKSHKLYEKTKWNRAADFLARKTLKEYQHKYGKQLSLVDNPNFLKE